MQRFKLQFVRKFHLALALLLLATLAVAWLYNDSIERHRHDVRQITLLNKILQSYQQLSILTFRELAVLSDSVLLGDSTELSEQGPGASALREAISNVRGGIAEQVILSGSGDEAREPGQVVEIENLVEEIIRSHELIGQALKEGRTGDARNELDRLRVSGFADNFNTLIVAAKADQKVYSWNVNQEATRLAGYVADLLPILMAVLVVIILPFIFILRRHLIHSVSALYQGALAFRNGDLSYRIPELREKEFQRLGEAFNIMAFELYEHRKQLHDTNIELEKTADERTGELQESNRQLASADLKRRKLLANISHEFRTPLTVIRGEAEIALRGSDKTEMDIRDSFQRIIDQVDNSTRLVDDLLFIARVDAGEPRLKLGPVSIPGEIDTVCQEYSARAEKMEIKIERGRMVTGSVVHGDPGRLRQVFAILLENALRYSNPGDSVVIQVRQGDGSVEIVFRDEGIGLNEEESELVFERFYRAQRAIDKAPGTGLGLPVAKAIVEAHNGTISLSGKPDQGATATVVLPFGRHFGIIA